MIYRIPEPRVATLIFSSGKLVCTGAKDIEGAKKGIHTVVGNIRDLGIEMPNDFEIRIENIVASTKIEAEGKFNLEEIAFSLENTEARTVEDIHTALGKLKETLESIGIKVRAVREDSETNSAG